MRCPDCRMILDKCECWMDKEQQEEDQVGGRMHESDNEDEQQGDTEELEINVTENIDTDSGYDRTGLTQEKEETRTPVQITVSLQNVLDKAEEQEWVNEQRE